MLKSTFRRYFVENKDNHSGCFGQINSDVCAKKNPVQASADTGFFEYDLSFIPQKRD